MGDSCQWSIVSLASVLVEHFVDLFGLITHKLTFRILACLINQAIEDTYTSGASTPMLIQITLDGHTHSARVKSWRSAPTMTTCIELQLLARLDGLRN